MGGDKQQRKVKVIAKQNKHDTLGAIKQQRPWQQKTLYSCLACLQQI